MAKINYSDYANSGSAKNSTMKKEFKVGFFSGLLKNDGDEVIVRFDYDSPADFNIESIHKKRVGQRVVNVRCLKDRGASKDVCPFCNSSDPEESKIYLRLFTRVLVYTKDSTGALVAKANVWERPAAFSKDIVAAYKDGVTDGFYPEGTPIRDIVFRIIRNGAAGSRDTKYRVKATNPSVYKSELYTPSFVDFADLDLAHHSYKDYTAEEQGTFLLTGELPVKQKTTDVTTAAVSTPIMERTVTVNPTVTPTTETERPRRFTQF